MPEERNRCAGRNRDDKPCTGDAYEQYSLGIYAGRYCDGHWATSGYRKEPASAFDPADCGETYEPDDWGEGGDW